MRTKANRPNLAPDLASIFAVVVCLVTQTAGAPLPALAADLDVCAAGTSVPESLRTWVVPRSPAASSDATNLADPQMAGGQPVADRMVPRKQVLGYCSSLSAAFSDLSGHGRAFDAPQRAQEYVVARIGLDFVPEPAFRCGEGMQFAVSPDLQYCLLGDSRHTVLGRRACLVDSTGAVLWCRDSCLPAESRIEPQGVTALFWIPPWSPGAPPMVWPGPVGVEFVDHQGKTLGRRVWTDRAPRPFQIGLNFLAESYDFAPDGGRFLISMNQARRDQAPGAPRNNTNLYCLDLTGGILWERHLGPWAARFLIARTSGVIVVSLRDYRWMLPLSKGKKGALLVMDWNGQVLSRTHVPNPIDCELLGPGERRCYFQCRGQLYSVALQWGGLRRETSFEAIYQLLRDPEGQAQVDVLRLLAAVVPTGFKDPALDVILEAIESHGPGPWIQRFVDFLRNPPERRWADF
jgi:hypothetical protein